MRPPKYRFNHEAVARFVIDTPRGQYISSGLQHALKRARRYARSGRDVDEGPRHIREKAALVRWAFGGGRDS